MDSDGRRDLYGVESPSFDRGRFWSADGGNRAQSQSRRRGRGSARVAQGNGKDKLTQKEIKMHQCQINITTTTQQGTYSSTQHFFNTSRTSLSAHKNYASSLFTPTTLLDFSSILHHGIIVLLMRKHNSAFSATPNPGCFTTNCSIHPNLLSLSSFLCCSSASVRRSSSNNESRLTMPRSGFMLACDLRNLATAPPITLCSLGGRLPSTVVSIRVSILSVRSSASEW